MAVYSQFASHPDLPSFQVVKPGRFSLDDLKLPDGTAMVGPDGLLVPSARSFATIINQGTRVFSYRFDEAMRDNWVQARSMRRDAFIRGLLEERILPTINRKWQLEIDDENDPTQSEVRDGLAKILQTVSGFDALKRALLDAVWFGRSGAQWNYARNPDLDHKWSIGKWDPLHGDSIQYTFDGHPAVLLDTMTAGWYQARGATSGPNGDIRPTDRGGMALVLHRPYWRERFAIHVHMREKADFFEGELAGSVQGLGLRGLVYWQYIVRTEALTWMLTYMQAVGQMDLLVFNYPAGDAAAEARAISNASKIIGKAAIAMPRNPQGNWPAVEQIPMNDAGLKALHELVAEYFDRHIERLIVGQSMSAGGGEQKDGLGGTGRAEFAKATKDEILIYDTNRLDETITADIVTPLKKYNYPFARFPVRYKSVMPDLEKSERVGHGQTLVSMGVPIKVSELREAAGYSRPKEGDEVVGAQPPPMPGMPGMGPPGPDSGPMGGMGGGGPMGLPGGAGAPGLPQGPIKGQGPHGTPNNTEGAKHAQEPPKPNEPIRSSAIHAAPPAAYLERQWSPGGGIWKYTTGAPAGGMGAPGGSNTYLPGFDKEKEAPIQLDSFSGPTMYAKVPNGLQPLAKAVRGLSLDEADGLRVFVHPDGPQAWIDQMDWHDGDGGKKVIAVAEEVIGVKRSESPPKPGQPFVHVTNEGPNPPGEGWVDLMDASVRYARGVHYDTDRKGNTGRWVTIGAQTVTDDKGKKKGKKTGGTPVFIKDGEIIKGPDSLEGQDVSDLDSRPNEPGAARPEPQRTHGMTGLAEPDRDWGPAEQSLQTALRGPGGVADLGDLRRQFAHFHPDVDFDEFMLDMHERGRVRLVADMDPDVARERGGVSPPGGGQTLSHVMVTDRSWAGTDDVRDQGAIERELERHYTEFGQHPATRHQSMDVRRAATAIAQDAFVRAREAANPEQAREVLAQALSEMTAAVEMAGTQGGDRPNMPARIGAPDPNPTPAPPDPTTPKLDKKGKAKVRVDRGTARVPTDQLWKDIGANIPIENASDLIGVLGEQASVVVAGTNASGHLKEVNILGTDPRFSCQRTLMRHRDGTLEIHNDLFEVTGEKGTGIGIEVFANQVRTAQAAGVKKITTYAAGSKGHYYNGYYTWPRFGYDWPVSSMPSSVQREVRGLFPNAKSVLDIMATEEGRQWWKDNGRGSDQATFDLTPGSRSMQVLDAYLAAKEKLKGSTASPSAPKSPTSDPTTKPPSTPPGTSSTGNPAASRPSWGIPRSPAIAEAIGSANQSWQNHPARSADERRWQIITEDAMARASRAEDASDAHRILSQAEVDLSTIAHRGGPVPEESTPRRGDRRFPPGASREERRRILTGQTNNARGTDPTPYAVPPFKFRSTQITVTGIAAIKLLEYAHRIPDLDLAKDGRELDPHITVRYGLHDFDPGAVADILKNHKPIKAKLGKVSVFESDDKDYDVIKVEVTSPGLRRINRALGELPNTQTFAYNPHATIAYVKKGLGKEWADRMEPLNLEIEADAVVLTDKDGDQAIIPLGGK